MHIRVTDFGSARILEDPKSSRPKSANLGMSQLFIRSKLRYCLEKQLWVGTVACIIVNSFCDCSIKREAWIPSYVLNSMINNVIFA